MSDSPFELLPLVTVATFSTPWEAQLAQARLAAFGIHSLIAGEHLIRMVALSNAIGGVRLQVRDEDAGAAAEALQGFSPLPEIYLVGQEAAAGAADAPESAGEAPEGRCPSCGSADLRLERSSRLLLGVLPVARRALRCGACGVLWRRAEVDAGGTAAATSGIAGTAGTTVTAGAKPGAGDDVDAPLATVARFHTPWEAHLARTLLESEGMRACVVEERLPNVSLLSAAPLAANRLEVCQGDAVRAAAILARAWSYPSPVELPDGDPEGGGSGPC